MKLSVVIVNYNVKHFLEQCLNSVIKALGGLKGEIIVVDNNSVDGSVKLLKDKFKDIKLIANKKNTGFAVANNQAIKIAKGEYVLLLNPDTIVQEDTFLKCLEFMDKTSNAGALGVKMYDGKGLFLPESKRGLPTPSVAFYKIFGLSTIFPKSKIFGKYHLGYLSKNEIHEVDVLSGAFMLLRKKALDKIGLLDESFFMYGEDIDLSFRIIKGGYKNYYFPKTNIIHYKGESTKKSSINYVFIFYKAMIIFAEKHFSKKNIKSFSRLINLAIYIRATIAVVQRVIRRWGLPILDFFFFTGLIYGLALFYQWFTTISFPSTTIKFILPFYALIWTITNSVLGNHNPPVNYKKILKSNLIGLLILLAFYALIPKSVQFSRAIILGSSILTFIGSLLTRHTFQYLQIGLYKNYVKNNKTMAVVGSLNEIARIEQLVKNNVDNFKKIYRINPFKKEQTSNGFDGDLSQLNEFVMINKIDEVIFCAKDISSQNIIYSMANIETKKRIDFKIIPEKSQFIIGSQSIYTNENFYTTNLKNINSQDNIRKKRAFDIYAGFALLTAAPILFFFKGYTIAIKNILAVLIGKKTWVGYENNSQNINLPKIKPSVFSVVNNSEEKKEDVTAKINIIYAKDYSLMVDFNLFIKRILNS